MEERREEGVYEYGVEMGWGGVGWMSLLKSFACIATMQLRLNNEATFVAFAAHIVAGRLVPHNCTMMLAGRKIILDHSAHPTHIT